MATVNKNFKVKNGLVVEGSTATVNGNQVLTETASDQYIIDLIGGETLITSVDSADFTVTSGELNIAAGSDIARDGDITTAINALDTDDIEEGSTNLYYSDTLVDSHLSGGDGISYSAGTISADLGTGLNISAGQIAVNRTTVDTWYDAAGAAAAAQTAAELYADGLAGNYDPAGTAAAEVAALVNGAPALLDTLNELAAAIGDDENFATTITGLVSDKQDTLTAGSNIDITGATISVTGLDAADISDFNTAALSATASAYDATGTAQGIVDALDTDDIEEGATNEYFTDVRAKSSAADLLTGATLSNITITGTGAGLTITAENGVAGSTTTDLTEGTNLYFTNERAQDAVGEAVGTGLTYTDSTGAISVTENTYDAYGSASAVAGDLTTHTSATEAHGATGAVVGTTNTQTLTNKTLTSPTLTTPDLGVATATSINSTSIPSSKTLVVTTDKLNVLAATSSSELAEIISDETGTGALVFADTPTLVTPIIGEATGTSLELSSNDLNVGSQSVGLRTSDGYTNPIAVFSIDADDDYAQLSVKNTGVGVNASTDIIAYADNGDDTSGWIDMGITSSTFNDPDFTITSNNDGYIFMEAPSGTTGNGDLVIATGANGAENRIVFAAGGLSSDNTQMTITPDESVRIVIPTASTSPTTGALVVDGGVGIQGDVNIQGTITFGGAGTTVTTDNLAVTDPIIYVGDGNTTDAVDMGLVTEYTDGTTKYAGIVRDATDGVFKLFEDASTKPTSTVNFAEAGLAYGDLKVDNIEAASGTFTNITIGGTVDETEIAHLNGVTSSIQNQLDAKLALAGGTMTGAIAMGTNKITGLGDPTSNQDAATKKYVDDQTTSDIAEGTNLYYTDARVDARLDLNSPGLSTSTPDFTEITVNSVAKQVAATVSVATASQVTAYEFLGTEYRSAKFLVKTAQGSHTDVAEVLLTMDSSNNISITEYAMVGTNGSLMTITADYVEIGTTVRLRVTTANNTSVVTVVGTLLA